MLLTVYLVILQCMLTTKGVIYYPEKLGGFQDVKTVRQAVKKWKHCPTFMFMQLSLNTSG